MNDYLTEIDGIIKQNFKYVTTWNSEIASIKSIDTTLLITKKNFLIIWLSSINEYLIEKIILLYYTKYFDLLREETGFENYINYEMHKIEQVVEQNHDWSFKWFSSILSLIMWNMIWIWKIEKFIESDFKGDLGKFKGKMTDIRKLRNKLWHTSEYYFKTNKEIDFDMNKLEDHIKILEEWFIELSKSYFKSMDKLLDLQYKTLSKFPDMNK